MNQEEMEYMIGQQSLHTGSSQSAMLNAQAQSVISEQERGLAETQLEVDSILSRCYHLLRQDVYREKEDGTYEWKPLTNQKERTLSDWGVDRIMQICNFYINKNNLLSNYDDVQIDRIMLRFELELNDLVLLKYEILFNEPDTDECKRILLERIENKKKLRVFALELVGKPIDEKQIRDELLKELETKIEKEMEKVKVEKRKENIREYGIIMAQLDAIVFATYNRALRGEERGSIRRHTNISEIIGKPLSVSEQKKGGAFAWLRG